MPISFPHAKLNETGYPYLSLHYPDTGEAAYTGRDIGEYFQHYNSSFCLNWKIKIWHSAGSWSDLGTVEGFLKLKCFPKVNVELVYNDIETDELIK